MPSKTGTVTLKVHCMKCGSCRVELPDGWSSDSNARCGNGHELGPYSALEEVLIGEPGGGSAANAHRGKPEFDPFEMGRVKIPVKAPIVNWSGEGDGDPYIRFDWPNGKYTEVKMAHEVLAQLAKNIQTKLNERTFKP